jgi:hypothetical protein
LPKAAKKTRPTHAGKAEGSSEIVEADLEDAEN